MKKGLTELVFILDRSGSMHGLEQDTIGGFNSMIDQQRREPGTAYVSTVLFDTGRTVLHDRVPLDRISPMTDRDYTVGGCTALLDAVGVAIHHIGNIHKYARPEDVPEKTLFVIITDGQENASQTCTAVDIRRDIARQKERYGWEFLFLGANIDAESTGEKYGIGRSRSVTYVADSLGTRLNYQTVSRAMCAMRRGQSIPDDWADEISRR